MLEKNQVIEAWYRSVRNEKAPLTVVNYTRRFSRFEPFIPQDLTQLSWTHIEDFLETIQHLNVNTVDSFVTTIKSFCKWACEHFEELPRNPANLVRYRVRKLSQRVWKRKVLSREEYETIVLKAKGPLRDAIQFIAVTGLRNFEFLTLKWSMFDDQLCSVTVRGKGGKVRIVPTDHPIAQEILRRYHGQPGPIGFVQPFRRYTRALSYDIRPLADKCRMGPMGPHALRHYFATTAVESGIPIAIVSAILGHSSTAITEMIYTHLTKQSVMGWTQKIK